MHSNCIYKKQIHSNVINIESEKLFREAEDCFLYFNQIRKATLKLNKALKISPNHYKSLILRGDIYFINGKIKEALSTYKKAETVCPKNIKIAGSIAVCLEIQNDYQEALFYCNKAFSLIDRENQQIYASLYELKTNILVKLRKYEEAKNLISNAKYHLLFEDIKTLKLNCQKIINEKLKIQNKLKMLNLTLV